MSVVNVKVRLVMSALMRSIEEVSRVLKHLNSAWYAVKLVIVKLANKIEEKEGDK